MQILIYLVIAIGFYLFMKRLFTVGGSPVEKRLLVGLAIGILLVLFYMVAHGRVQFLAPLMAGLIPVVRRLPLVLGLLGKAFPNHRSRFLDSLKSKFSGRSNDRTGTQSGDKSGSTGRKGENVSGDREGRRSTSGFSRRDALDALGLQGNPDRATVTTAHRRLMQTAHPDHGGTHEAAATLNAAKDRLIADLGK